jgi:hypothetical protein
MDSHRRRQHRRSRRRVVVVVAPVSLRELARDTDDAEDDETIAAAKHRNH